MVHIHVDYNFASQEKLNKVKLLVDELSVKSQQVINELTRLYPSPSSEWLQDFECRAKNHIDCFSDYISIVEQNIAEYNRNEEKAIELLRKKETSITYGNDP